jgi:phosphoglycolate phosphatase
MLNQIKTIVWDWNGTLIDDLKETVIANKEALTQLGYEQISHEFYKNNFALPVDIYYKAIGIRPCDYAKFSELFLAGYRRRIPSMSLYDQVIPYLSQTKAMGIKHIILSAYEHNGLTEWLDSMDLLSHFDGVFGAHNSSGQCKKNAGKRMVSAMNLDINHCVYFGDTLHDAHVAKYLGITPLLLASGHNDEARLNTVGCKVYPHFSNMYDQFLAEKE